jgi:hypothetical protein
MDKFEFCGFQVGQTVGFHGRSLKCVTVFILYAIVLAFRNFRKGVSQKPRSELSHVISQLCIYGVANEKEMHLRSC